MASNAVIIGAGPSGLAAAARLTHFGVPVTVLEAHCRLGGLSSWHHVRGREVSSGLHAFTNYSASGRDGALGKLLRQLRLKPADLALAPQRRSCVRFPSARLYFNNDPEYFRSRVAEAFPRQIDAFDRFRRLILDTDEGEFTRVQRSARRMMSEYISDPLLTDMLLCPVMYYGNPGGVGDGEDAGRIGPDMDWLLFCVVWKCIFESGFGHPVHGMRGLWELLADRIRADGGDIRLGTRVAELIVRDGKAVAARLTGGEEIEGELFFSSAGAVETERLVCPDTGPKTPVGSISIVEGITLLDAPAAEAGMADTVIFYSFSDKLAFRRPDLLTTSDTGVVAAPGNYDYAEGNAETELLKMTMLASYPAWRGLSAEAYRIAKHNTATDMEQALGKLGIVPSKARVTKGKYGDFDDLFTPLTLERFTLHAEGALYGSPVKNRGGVTDYPNVFLIGADQGFHGIVGAMLSGVAMVNRHLLAAR